MTRITEPEPVGQVVPRNGHAADTRENRMAVLLKDLPVGTMLYEAPPAAQPEPVAGWRMVPAEPTREMLDAPLPASPVGNRYESRRDLRPMIYLAMLAAAPPAPAAPVVSDAMVEAARAAWMDPAASLSEPQRWCNALTAALAAKETP